MPRWRFKCPLGHTSVDAINSHFLCRSCQRDDDLDHDGTYDEIYDAKQSERIDRADLRELEANQRARAD